MKKMKIVFSRILITLFGFAIILLGMTIWGIDKTPLSSSENSTIKALGGTTIQTHTWITTATTIYSNNFTPSEAPLFTKAEVKAADPFDLSTFPQKFVGIIEHPENATAEQWVDTHNFIITVREKEGISPICELSEHTWCQLGSLWNLIKYVQGDVKTFRENIDKAVISPIEMSLMIGDNTILVPNWYALGPNGRLYIFGFDYYSMLYIGGDTSRYYNPENIGPILGRNDIHPNRIPYVSVSGNFALIGTFAGRDNAIIDAVFQDGYHRLFPVVVSFEPITLPAGSKCINLATNIKPTIYALPSEIILSELLTGNGKKVSQQELFAALGKQVGFNDDGYSFEVREKFGLLSGPQCLSPEGLEMASNFMVDMYLDAIYWPWVDEVPKPAPTPGW